MKLELAGLLLMMLLPRTVCHAACKPSSILPCGRHQSEAMLRRSVYDCSAVVHVKLIGLCKRLQRLCKMLKFQLMFSFPHLTTEFESQRSLGKCFYPSSQTPGSHRCAAAKHCHVKCAKPLPATSRSVPRPSPIRLCNLLGKTSNTNTLAAHAIGHVAFCQAYQ